jgi:hypothetical protein
MNPCRRLQFEQLVGLEGRGAISFAGRVRPDRTAADEQQRPLDLAIGQIVKLGKLPLNLQASGYYKVEKPDYGPDWQLRIQVALLFQK